MLKEIKNVLNFIE